MHWFTFMSLSSLIFKSEVSWRGALEIWLFFPLSNEAAKKYYLVLSEQVEVKMAPLCWSFGSLLGLQMDVRWPYPKEKVNNFLFLPNSLPHVASCSLYYAELWGGEGPICSRGPGDILSKNGLVPPPVPSPKISKLELPSGQREHDRLKPLLFYMESLLWLWKRDIHLEADTQALKFIFYYDALVYLHGIKLVFVLVS